MIDPSTLHNRAVTPGRLTARQERAAELVERYHSAAEELPSAGWLARRMGISRQRARAHMEAIRRGGRHPLSK